MTEQGQATEALSKREQEVADAYAAGQSYKEIARELGLSPTTVRSHLRTVYSKLGVTSKIELAQFLTDASVPEDGRDSATLVADLALELDDAVRREQSLAKILNIISKQDEKLEPVLDAVLDHALEICEAQFGSLFEIGEDKRARLVHSRNIAPAFEAWLLDLGAFELEPESVIGRMAATLQTANVADVHSEDLYESGSPIRIATMDLGKARSFAAIPMISGDRLTGAFIVYRTRVHPFNDRALDLAQVFADQAAIAIENARQFRELQNRLAREQGTAEILRLISQSLEDESPVFDLILKNASHLCGADAAALTLGAEGDTHQRLAASRDVHPTTKAHYDAGRVSMTPTSFAAKAILSGDHVYVEDFAETDGYREGDAAMQSLVDDTGMRTSLFVPLMSKTGGIGALILFRKQVRPYTDDEIALVKSFATQAVIAIEHVGQFRQLQARLERAAATREILQLISQSRDDEAPVFAAIVGNVGKLCGGANVALHLANPARTKATYVAGWGDPTKNFQPGVSTWPLSDPLPLTEAIRDAKVINIPDSAEEAESRERHPDRAVFVDRDGIRSQLVVPLLKEGQGVGCFEIYRREVNPFLEDEVALVESFAAQAVIAIENVRQFKLLQARTEEVQALNASLEARVDEQVGEIERMGRLKRFLSPAVADALVTSGDEAALSSHRALIATLFCDIRGFTAFCETAEPEETIEVLQVYHEEMGNLISAHGGGVDKRMGDGIMVIFNDPLPCEDPAGDAVRLAVAMRERMVELCKKWKRLGHRLGFGVGVSFGYATIGMVGSEGRYDYTASGTSVNLAARLCDRAEDGEILLSPRAYTAVEDDFRAESSGEVSLKGIREPLEVFRLAEPVSK
ncbi:MAG: GAF domain-containing protein [Alphaproteobacteria bacterium]|nr:GAF domain-containing protein [Alphaproteobacteria bacterium]